MKNKRKLHYSMKALRRLNAELVEADEVIGKIKLEDFSRKDLYSLISDMRQGYIAMSLNIKNVNNALATDNAAELENILDKDDPEKSKEDSDDCQCPACSLRIALESGVDIKEVSLEDAPQPIKDFISKITGLKKQSPKSEKDNIVAGMADRVSSMPEDVKAELEADLRKVLDAIAADKKKQ